MRPLLPLHRLLHTAPRAQQSSALSHTYHRTSRLSEGHSSTCYEEIDLIARSSYQCPLSPKEALYAVIPHRVTIRFVMRSSTQPLLDYMIGNGFAQLTHVHIRSNRIAQQSYDEPIPSLRVPNLRARVPPTILWRQPVPNLKLGCTSPFV